MIRCRLAASAENVSRDAASDALSLSTVIERIQVSSFPVNLPRVSNVFLMSREPGDPKRVECVMRLEHAGKTLNEFPVTVEFGESLMGRAIVVLQGVPLDEPGVLRVVLLEGESELGKWEMEATVLPSN